MRALDRGRAPQRTWLGSCLGESSDQAVTGSFHRRSRHASEYSSSSATTTSIGGLAIWLEREPDGSCILCIDSQAARAGRARTA